MLKLLFVTSCVLAVSRAFFMPQAGTNQLTGMPTTKTMLPAQSIYRFGRITMDFSKYTNLESICNAAVAANGGVVSDSLSDIMKTAVQFMQRMNPMRSPLTFGQGSTNNAKWECLMRSVTRGGRNMANAAGGVSDYFDTAAELPIKHLLPFSYNPCQMLFCGEGNMTPLNMAMEVARKLRMGQSLGSLGQTVFGKTLATRLQQHMATRARNPMMGAMGGMGMMMGGAPSSNPSSPSLNPMAQMAASLGNMMMGGNSMGASSGSSMGQTGVSPNTMGQSGGTPNTMGQTGASSNTMGQTSATKNTMGQPGASSNGMGQTGGAAMPSSGGLNPSGQNPWAQNPLGQAMSGMGLSGLSAFKTSADALAKMAASLSGAGNNGATTGTGSGSGGNNMWQDMMRMMSGNMNTMPSFSSPLVPSSNNAAAGSNTGAAAGLGGMMTALLGASPLTKSLLPGGASTSGSGSGSGSGSATGPVPGSGTGSGSAPGSGSTSGSTSGSASGSGSGAANTMGQAPTMATGGLFGNFGSSAPGTSTLNKLMQGMMAYEAMQDPPEHRSRGLSPGTVGSGGLNLPGLSGLMSGLNLPGLSGVSQSGGGLMESGGLSLPGMSGLNLGGGDLMGGGTGLTGAWSLPGGGKQNGGQSGLGGTGGAAGGADFGMLGNMFRMLG
ncbi:uncharacterized protein LOC143277813 isoform X2 [Babylonia areolata]|uniref:uncharacterized protein LOC143277813 isoform X2 n=1 Tax=Babylonia areolata TaxID=304850 RepID=UPI003FD5D43B